MKISIKKYFNIVKKISLKLQNIYVIKNYKKMSKRKKNMNENIKR